ERTQAGRKCEQLVPEADAEHGHATEQLAHGRDLVSEWLRVAGAVREEHAVVGAERVGVDVVWEDGDRSARACEAAQDRALRAVVADHRSGEADELAAVARVGDDLLVAAHRRREDRLAERGAGRADALAAEDGPVLEHEVAHVSYATRPAAIVVVTLPCSRSPS